MYLIAAEIALYAAGKFDELRTPARTQPRNSHLYSWSSCWRFLAPDESPHVRFAHNFNPRGNDQ